MRGLSFFTKVFLLFAGAVLLIVVPALVLIAEAVEERVYARATEELVGAKDALQYYWHSEDEKLLESARSRSLDPAVVSLFVRQDSAALDRYVKRQAGRGREVLAADMAGNVIAGPKLDSTTLQGGDGWGSLVTYTRNDSTPLRVAFFPAAGDSGFVGVIGVGTRLDSTAAKSIKELTQGTDVALVVGDSLVATTLPASAAKALRASSLPASTRGGVTDMGGVSYLSRVYPLPTQGVPAAVILFRPVQNELRIAKNIWSSIVVIGIATLVLSLLVAWVVARIVARPTQALADAAARLAEGDYRAPLPPAGTDEIGQLARAFGEMRAGVEEREARLRSAQAELIHREKLAAMGRLVAQLSHEINNPIYNIQNCLEALERRGRPDDPNREFLELAQEELARMAGLTRQLLDQSRPVSDAARPLDLNSVVRRVLSLAATDVQAHEVEAVLRLDPELPPVVAHPDAIQQVLANLVRNALDAMPHGGVLTVESYADGDQVEVLVEDTGGGIPDEHLPHIFEAFFTTKAGVTGIGLGLFVSEGIVRGHRGRLHVDSNPGAGSRFTLRLPREALAEPAAA